MNMHHHATFLPEILCEICKRRVHTRCFVFDAYVHVVYVCTRTYVRVVCRIIFSLSPSTRRGTMKRQCNDPCVCTRVFVIHAYVRVNSIENRTTRTYASLRRKKCTIHVNTKLVAHFVLHHFNAGMNVPHPCHIRHHLVPTV